MKWGCFGNKVENVKKWTFPQGRVHYVQYQYFWFYILFICGGCVRNAPPPGYGPVYTLHWCMMTALASGMEQGWSATGDDVVVGIPSSLFITMSCLATLGTIYSLVLIVFNVVYRNDRYETFVSRVLYFLLCNKRLCCRVGRKSEATNSWPQFCQILIDLQKKIH